MSRKRSSRPPAGRVERKPAIAAGPWYSSGSGGIVSQASSVSRATTPSTSPPSKASVKRATSSRSSREFGSGTCSARRNAQAGVERRPGPVERARDRRFGDAERLGYLGRAEAEHVAQHEHGALARREP